jgi:uncharacterized protein
MKKIALGTVQFGLDYGISNKTGKINPAEVADILDYAFHNGIDTIDTAVAYGASESIIGSILADKEYNFDIVSKFSSEDSSERFDYVLKSSLQKLHSKRLKGYLAHSFDAFKQQSLRQCLCKAKDQGLIQKIGVSVYYPEEIRWLLEKNIVFDIIQLPFNVFDQRFLSMFGDLKARNIEIHARSIFLQGLFFMDIEDLPEHFHSVKDRLIDLQKIADTTNIPLSALLLNHAVMQKDIDKVVIGISRLAELRENISAFHHEDQSRTVYSKLDSFSITDEKIILPFNWS